MAKFTRLQVAQKIHETALVPIFYHADLEVSKNIVQACYDAGVRVMEYTNRGDFAHELFSELNKYIHRQMPEMIFGVGSIIDAPTAALYMQIGANFIVSPVLKEEIAIVCNKRKIAWMPGCGSVSEISRAEELGAEFVKVFPAQSVGGPDFVKSVKGPMPWTSFMITGGVEPTEENIKKWFDAGAACVGMGSNLITSDIIRNRDYEKLTAGCKSVLGIIKKCR